MILLHRRLLGAITAATLAATLTATLACGSDSTAPTTVDRTALLKAESQWSAAAVHNYNYDLVMDQFGEHDSVDVQVRNDQLVSSTSYVDGQLAQAGETIPQFFSGLDDAMSAGLRVAVTYDPQFGYPAAGSVNPINSTPAGGASWQIVNFTRLP